ncbi:hypothetical protein [Mucilaginibacter sp.]
MRAEGFFRLDIIHQLYVSKGVHEIASLSFATFWIRPKVVAPAAMSGTEQLIQMKIFLLSDSEECPAVM